MRNSQRWNLPGSLFRFKGTKRLKWNSLTLNLDSCFHFQCSSLTSIIMKNTHCKSAKNSIFSVCLLVIQQFAGLF